MYPKVRYLKSSKIFIWKIIQFCFLNLKKDNMLFLIIGFRISKNYNI